MYLLFNIIITLCVWADGVIAADFVIHFHSSSWKKNKRFFLFIPLAYLIPQIFGAKETFSFIQLLVIMVLLFLFSLPFPGSYIRHALSSILFYTTLGSVNMSIIMVYCSWRRLPIELLSKGINLDRAVVMLVSKIFMFVICRIITELIKGYQVSRNREFALLIIVPILNMAVLSFIGNLGLQYPMESLDTLVLSLLSLCIFVANLIQYYYFSQVAKKIKLEMDNDLLQRQLDFEKEQLCEVQKAYDNIRQVKHDMKNSLLGIEHCVMSGNMEQSMEMIERVIGQIDISYQFIQTSNTLLNYIINSKCNMAVKQGISVDIHVDSNGVDMLDENEMCILLGNLMDNAIEASVKEPKNREICLNIYEKKGFLVVQVKNRISSSVLRRNPRLATGKKNTFDHGLGLPKIKRIVKDHGGNVDIYEMEGMFCMQISLPKSPLAVPEAAPTELIQCQNHPV